MIKQDIVYQTTHFTEAERESCYEKFKSKAVSDYQQCKNDTSYDPFHKFKKPSATSSNNDVTQAPPRSTVDFGQMEPPAGSVSGFASMFNISDWADSAVSNANYCLDAGDLIDGSESICLNTFTDIGTTDVPGCDLPSDSWADMVKVGFNILGVSVDNCTQVNPAFEVSLWVGLHPPTMSIYVGSSHISGVSKCEKIFDPSDFVWPQGTPTYTPVADPSDHAGVLYDIAAESIGKVRWGNILENIDIELALLLAIPLSMAVSVAFTAASSSLLGPVSIAASAVGGAAILFHLTNNFAKAIEDSINVFGNPGVRA